MKNILHEEFVDGKNTYWLRVYKTDKGTIMYSVWRNDSFYSLTNFRTYLIYMVFDKLRQSKLEL